MLYTPPATSFAITPDPGNIVAPSPGSGLKLNVPPIVLITPGDPPEPAQKSEYTKVGSSLAVIETVIVCEESKHEPGPVTVYV